MVTVYLSAKRSDCFDPDTYKDTGELLGLIPPAPPRVRPDFAELMMKPPHKIVRNHLEQSSKPESPVSVEPRCLFPQVDENRVRRSCIFVFLLARSGRARPTRFKAFSPCLRLAVSRVAFSPFLPA